MSQSNQTSISHHLSSGIVICSTDHEQMKFWSNVTKKTVRSYWLTTTVFCTKTTNFLSSVIHTWLYNFAEEREGHGAGVGEVREQSECATASTMMTHLVPCETKACEALNWHTRRELTSRQHVREGLTVSHKTPCFVLRNRPPLHFYSITLGSLTLKKQKLNFCVLQFWMYCFRKQC